MRTVPMRRAAVLGNFRRSVPSCVLTFPYNPGHGHVMSPTATRLRAARPLPAVPVHNPQH